MEVKWEKGARVYLSSSLCSSDPYLWSCYNLSHSSCKGYFHITCHTEGKNPDIFKRTPPFFLWLYVYSHTAVHTHKLKKVEFFPLSSQSKLCVHFVPLCLTFAIDSPTGGDLGFCMRMNFGSMWIWLDPRFRAGRVLGATIGCTAETSPGPWKPPEMLPTVVSPWLEPSFSPCKLLCRWKLTTCCCHVTVPWRLRGTQL